MSTLRESKITLLSANFHGESTLPAIAFSLGAKVKIHTRLDENDELFTNYGSVDSVYPYRCQDLYDRTQKPAEYRTVTLENENLKAVFLPEFGGKLRELTDKHTGQNLLFSNDVVRPCNLAVRNAWMSGGIEWNSGFRGHHPFTCSLINTAKTKLDDGTPVLRFYYFERIRCSVIQMDFFLPDVPVCAHKNHEPEQQRDPDVLVVEHCCRAEGRRPCHRPSAADLHNGCNGNGGHQD